MTPTPWDVEYNPPDALSELERAVFEMALQEAPSLRIVANRDLRVCRRAYTVKGLYLDFQKNWFREIQPRRHDVVSLDLLIESDAIDNGASASLFVLDNVVLGMEFFAYGDVFGEVISKFTISSRR